MAATYVIGRDRRILKAFVDPDYKLRATVEDVIAVLSNPAPQDQFEARLHRLCVKPEEQRGSEHPCFVPTC